MDLAGRLPQQAAEAPRVIEAQHPLLPARTFHRDVDMIVRTHRRIHRQHPQAAGHAQVQQRAAAVHIHQQVLGPPPHLGDALAGQLARDLRRNRPAQIRPAQRHLADAPSFQMRGQTPAGGFDFGQFGHGETGAAGKERR